MPTDALFQRLSPRAGAPIAFTINGAPAEAMPGDLLITAILLNRSALRKFEFGDEMRAGFCLMGACQDCWVQLANGERLRACTSLATAGMAVIIPASDR